MADTRLTKTFSSSGNRNKWTVSAWVKRAKIGSAQTIIACHQNGSYKTRLMFDASDQLYFNDEYNNNTNGRIVSNAKYRDTSAWYHVVGIWDKDNATSADKIRFYVNGERITSFSDTGNAPANASTFNVDGIAHEIGAEASGNYFDGCMTHIHMCDGYAYEPSNFGSTDSTTGQWKINISPSVSYGTNGFFILKNGNSVTDQSGNSNNWNVTAGTLTQTEDNPSNVFAVWNRLMSNTPSDYTFAYGNTKVTPTGNGSYNHGISTLGMKKGNGKYYCEIKWHVNDNVGSAGIIDSETANQAWNDNTNINDHTVKTEFGRCVFRDDGNIKIPNTNTSSGVSMTNGDILGIAFDAENGKVYFHVNGTYVTTDSVQHNPSAGTGGIDITGHSSWVDGSIWHWYCGDGSSSGYSGYSLNAGNGYFEGTAVTSAGTNSGVGVFEYDMPTGFKALCTKNLNI